MSSIGGYHPYGLACILTGLVSIIEHVWICLADELQPVNPLPPVYRNFGGHCWMSGVIFPKIRLIIGYSACLGVFIFDKGENASQVAEILNGVYDADTLTANYLQFWFRRFHSGIFDVKDAPRTGRPVNENVDKITEIIKVDRYVSSCRIAQ
ncbi:histone-lysine N-methyltransferase SETMAR [Trichonephila clavipes]|nr:histone-lysine N-methyltransferase SETMAR [Trichonephila clavipes]